MWVLYKSDLHVNTSGKQLKKSDFKTFKPRKRHY